LAWLQKMSPTSSGSGGDLESVAAAWLSVLTAVLAGFSCSCWLRSSRNAQRLLPAKDAVVLQSHGGSSSCVEHVGALLAVSWRAAYQLYTSQECVHLEYCLCKRVAVVAFVLVRYMAGLSSDDAIVYSLLAPAFT
jgi:hypothetical protein